MGTPAIMYRANCDCTSIPKGRNDRQMLEHISTPYWQHLGLPPTPKEKAELKYLKDKNMSWSDRRKEIDFGRAKNPSGLEQMLNQKGNNETTQYKKNS